MVDLPLVFESGVLRFDDHGVLFVHLEHGPDDPHPLQTHPDGADGFVPASASELTLVGEGGKGAVNGRFPTSETLPQGFVFTISGYHFVQLEGSGDVSVLLKDVAELPDWFEPGKVHRFAREGADSPTLWAGSPDPTMKTSETPGWTPPTSRGSHTRPAAEPSGCLGMLLGLLPW